MIWQWSPLTTDVLAPATTATLKAGHSLGLFAFHLDPNGNHVIELSKQRLAADNQFLKIQTRSISHARIVSETERLIQQRADNMLRQRGLRLAKEASDRQAALAAQVSMKARRRPGFK